MLAVDAASRNNVAVLALPSGRSACLLKRSFGLTIVQIYVPRLVSVDAADSIITGINKVVAPNMQLWKPLMHLVLPVRPNQGQRNLLPHVDLEMEQRLAPGR